MTKDMRRYAGILFVLTLFLSGAQAYAGSAAIKPQSETNPVDFDSLRRLKVYMEKFGVTMAGLEMGRAKDEKPDWIVIGIGVDEMDDALQAMKKADTQGVYRTFTDQLSSKLKKVKIMAKNKDARIYESLDDVRETCFQCHTAHRPADFLIHQN